MALGTSLDSMAKTHAMNRDTKNGQLQIKCKINEDNQNKLNTHHKKKRYQNITTCNVRTKVMKDYKINIMALQETIQKGNNIIDMGNFQMCRSGKEESRMLGTGFLLSSSMARKIIGFKFLRNRICLLRIKNAHLQVQKNKSNKHICSK